VRLDEPLGVVVVVVAAEVLKCKKGGENSAIHRSVDSLNVTR
jgi:hypothetical protein